MTPAIQLPDASAPLVGGGEPRGGRLSGTAREYFHAGGVFGALVLIGAVLTMASPHFLTHTNLINILLQSATLSIISAGLTMILITGEIDLSIASVQALSGTIAAIFIIQLDLPMMIGIGGALGVGLLIGAINGYLTVFAKVPSFIVTLASFGILQGIALLLTNAQPVAGFPEAYGAIGQDKIAGIPVPVVLAGAVYCVMHFILAKTRFGVDLYAIGGGRRAAELTGIRVGRALVLGFCISGLLAGLAGVILSSRLDAGSGTFGVNDLLTAVAAVVIGGTSLVGGTGTVIGTLGGVLLITTIGNGLILLNVTQFWQQIVVGLVLVAAVLIDQVVRGRVRLRDLVPRRSAW
jgi:ribose transport system permease protein